MAKHWVGLGVALLAAGCAAAGGAPGPAPIVAPVATSAPAATLGPPALPPAPGNPLSSPPAVGKPAWFPALPVPSPEAADPDPYQAPSFDGFVAGTAAGAWGGYYYVPASPPPTPTPAPVSTPLPLETWFRDLNFHATFPDGLVFPVGGTTRVAVTGLPAGARFGVLEPHASISVDGVVRATAPGPVHAYFEHQGGRWYWLLAAVPADAPGTGQWAGLPFLAGDWAAWIGTADELAAYWERAYAGIDEPPPVPSVDFAHEAVLAVAISQVWGQHLPVVTAIGDAVQLVAPDEHSPVVAGSNSAGTLFRLPRTALGRPVELVRLGARTLVQVQPPMGPSPHAEPPRPTPDPDHTTPPGGYGPPPCPPPGPCLPSTRPSPAPGGCPPDPAAYAAGPVPPTLVYGHPEIDANGYAPVLPIGGQLTFRLPDHPQARWRVADPAIGTIAPDGTLVARKPGAITVVAESEDLEARALAAAVAAPEPARTFRFHQGDADRPAAATPRGARIFRDADAWARFWREGFERSPLEAPPVDFARFDVVCWVEDRYAFHEHRPVLTHVSDARRIAHIVAPGVLTGWTGYPGARVRLFLTGKLAPDATVRVHTLCEP